MYQHLKEATDARYLGWVHSRQREQPGVTSSELTRLQHLGASEGLLGVTRGLAEWEGPSWLEAEPVSSSSSPGLSLVCVTVCVLCVTMCVHVCVLLSLLGPFLLQFLCLYLRISDPSLALFL